MVAAAPTVGADLIGFAEHLADLARPVVRRYYRTPIDVETKADASPVTIADREVEQALRAELRSRFPDHGIKGEEFGGERVDADYVWHLDPIDGTKSFVAGRPMFGTLIALAYQGRPILGVIDQCILDERWIGAAGHASRWNGAPIHCRQCPELGQAILCCTSPTMFAAGADRAAFGRLQDRVRYPIFGGDCYAYGLLAMGRIDLMVEASLDAYDFMALVPVIEGAGGCITDWHGDPLTSASDGRVLAAGDPRLHQTALRNLAHDAN